MMVRLFIGAYPLYVKYVNAKQGQISSTGNCGKAKTFNIKFNAGIKKAVSKFLFETRLKSPGISRFPYYFKPITLPVDL
jgi:hypothetical protein